METIKTIVISSAEQPVRRGGRPARKGSLERECPFAFPAGSTLSVQERLLIFRPPLAIVSDDD